VARAELPLETATDAIPCLFALDLWGNTLRARQRETRGKDNQPNDPSELSTPCPLAVLPVLSPAVLSVRESRALELLLLEAASCSVRVRVGAGPAICNPSAG